MHGFIFVEINKFVTGSLGAAAWTRLLSEAGLGSRAYLNGIDYPDEEAVKIVGTAAAITGQPVPEILESFGVFLGRDLLTAFRPLIAPEWRTLEFLENAERTIHEVVRARNPLARPPVLACHRASPQTVVIRYVSERRMTDLARGIIRGVAEHYGQRVTISVGGTPGIHDGSSYDISVTVEAPNAVPLSQTAT